jgi:hypothetical protein
MKKSSLTDKYVFYFLFFFIGKLFFYNLFNSNFGRFLI